MVLCEYCGENEAEFSIKVISPDGSVEESDIVCGGCVATWFTESPEDVKSMEVKKLGEAI